MTNYIQIDNIQNKLWKKYAEKIDNRKPDVNDPNDVGDAGDLMLSQREIEKLSTMISEYYTANPQKNSFGETVPVQELVTNAIKEIFGSTINYLKYKADVALSSINKFFSNI